MHPALHEKIETAISRFKVMETQDQLKKLHQILLVYSGGNAHMAEGLKMTYMALVTVHTKIRELDQVQQTLGLANAAKIETQFRKIFRDMMELTSLIFPNDDVMAWEMVREEYACAQQ